jgi:hypothetical protein
MALLLMQRDDLLPQWIMLQLRSGETKEKKEIVSVERLTQN